MGTVPLPELLKIIRAERIIPALCVAASLIGAGFVFFGANFSLINNYQVTLETEAIGGPYETHSGDVEGFLDEIGITIGEYDYVSPDPDEKLRNGLYIVYRQAKPVYVADSGHAPVEHMTASRTICGLLDEYAYSVSAMDRIDPHPSTPIEYGMDVRIDRVEVVDITMEREIEPELVIEPDPELPRGRMEEIDPGQPGIAEDITRHYYLNGEETVAVEIGSRVVSEPESRIARVGVRSMPPLASRGGVDRNVMEMNATAYDPGVLSCWPYADGLTATGHVAGFGVAAVDPTVIPLGTELWVEGYGYALACDTGGAIKGNRIDLCFDTRSEALRWGRRDVLVYILD